MGVCPVGSLVRKPWDCKNSPISGHKTKQPRHTHWPVTIAQYWFNKTKQRTREINVRPPTSESLSPADSPTSDLSLLPPHNIHSHITKPSDLITAYHRPYHLSLKISQPTSPPRTTRTSLAHTLTHTPSKTTLNQQVFTSNAVEMVNTVHARTTNTWKTEEHVLGDTGGGVRHHLPVSMRGGGDLGEVIFESCRLFFFL